MRETRVRSLGWEDPLEKEMVTHSSILAWRIPWREKAVHGVAKSQTRLSDFTFTFKHSLALPFFGNGMKTHFPVLGPTEFWKFDDILSTKL